MAVSEETPTAQVNARTEDGRLVLELAGVWQITAPRPSWKRVLGTQRPARVRLEMGGVSRWDSSLVLFVHEVRRWCTEAGANLDLDAVLPEVRRLADQLAGAYLTRPPFHRSTNFLADVGVATEEVVGKTRGFARFIGECTLAAVRLVIQPQKFRWRDCFIEMQQCGAMALPIVSLISFLVGLTLAYTGAIILRQFGADIWVADLVGLSSVREMGAIMTAVVLAGRTGAAFAAELGNMKTGEEIDALETLGIRPVDFLVIPRMVALAVMMPLLALYANCLGILGGMAVATGLLSIPPSAYWVETVASIGLTDINAGLIKACVFGLIVGMTGCLRGLQAERSAAGVGRAATSAVVTAILLIIVADATFAVVFNILHI
ncbi:MAG TPA: ABC transporter permease [Opitutaceae bacterium]|jgi:phospholipid/cholesterol/gamma-HCH transport system permease protein|nr:ABC transporter permease [Opitutaceae bacterium]